MPICGTDNEQEGEDTIIGMNRHKRVRCGLDVDIAEEAFRRMGYRAEFTTIDWEQKTELVDNGEIDCIWDCFSMDGRENDYQWAGPYLVSRQVIAVSAQSGIPELCQRRAKTHFGRKLAVQYAMLDCGYVDAVAAHEEAIRQYMKDYGANFRILDEPLLTTGIGVAFSKNDTRGLAAELTEVFAPVPRGRTFVPRRGIPAVPARGYAGLRAAHDRADRLCKGAVLLLCAV